MREETDSKSLVRISLIDVMYGVVLAYGFGFYDQADTAIDYIRFFFAYAVIITDWIYVHSLYWGWEYKYNSFLLLDIGILFTISRLLHASTVGHSSYYWLWMSILFLLYVIWDILSKQKKLPSKYDWCCSISGDLFAAIVFLAFHVFFSKGILPYSIFFNTILIIFYIVIIRLTWFKLKSKESIA